MQNAIQTKRGLRNALLAGAAAVALTGAPAIAQDEEAAPAEPAAQPTQERVVVTGTRIRQPNLTNNTPTSVVGSQQIELSGEANTADVLRDLPSVGLSGLSSTNSNFFTSSNGINTINLRNLGEDRTLVLVNGRRFVSGVVGANIVDFNQIPTALIDRIDVVTGGASAVYGSDAIAGVVNVILREDFEGVNASVSHGVNEVYTEADNWQAQVTVGSNFADGRGNAVLHLNYADNGPGFARDREGGEVDCLNELFFGSPPGFSPFRQFCPFFSSFIEGGRFTLSTGAGGSETSRVVLDPALGTIGTYNSALQGFNRNARRLNFVPFERYGFSGFVNYDVFPGHTLFAEINYASTESRSELEPFPLSSEDVYGVTNQGGALAGIPGGIPITNPYMPASLVALAISRGVDDVGFARRMSELGNRGNVFFSETARMVVGMEGEIGDWFYEVSYNFGRTTQETRGNGQVNVQNLRFALDAVDLGGGNIVCADPNARALGCVPINFFESAGGTPGTWTDDQIRWVAADQMYNNTIQQEIVAFDLSGPLFELPAGSILAAVGAEYRREFSEEVPDALSQAGLNAGNVAPVTRGNFDVWEMFGELQIPILSGLDFTKELTVNLSGRWSEYSTLGQTFAWAASGSWTITDDIRFRGQYARAVRAPNIGELFTGPSETFGTVADPCNNLRTALGGGPLPGGPTDPNVIANCLLDPGIAARANAATGFVLTQPELQGTGGFQQGNPALFEETATSYTFGVVLTPKFWEVLEPLTLTVDYYNIEIEDAIASVGRNTVLSLCYTGPVGLTSPFCGNGVSPTAGGPSIGLVRDVNGALTEVNTANANSNLIETAGIDVGVSYDWDLNTSFLSDVFDGDLGLLRATVLYSYLDDFTVTSLAGTPFEGVSEGKGDIGLWEHRAQLGLVYQVGDITLSYSGQWTGEVAEDQFYGVGIDSYWFHDVSARYDITETISIFGGVRNLADEYVFIGQSLPGIPTGWTTDPDAYDGLGRRWFFGIRFRQ